MVPSIPPRPRREPALNLPPAIMAAIGILVAIHALRLVVSEDVDAEILLRGAFIPAPWTVAAGLASPDSVAAEAVAGADEALASFRQGLARYVLGQGVQPWSVLTYSLLHGSWMHLGTNVVWLAAFGSPVAVRAGTPRLLALAAATALGGAAAQWVSAPLGVQPVIGASAILSGLMAAAATFMFAGRGADPARPGRWSFFRTRGALGFLGAWLAGNLLFGFAAEPLGLSDGAVAWQAHIGGLLVGLGLFPLIDPGPRRTSG